LCKIPSYFCAAPKRYSLSQNYPNPFNPTTQISFELPTSGIVNLTIYDILGKKVRELVNDFKPVGKYQIIWDGKNDDGEAVTSGLYIYKIIMGEYSKSRKMLLLR
jgi:flagellar hook assembly protein FlgD